MAQKSGKKMVGVYVRVEENVLATYDEIALRATGVRLGNGNRRAVTTQDVMRHRLNSLPLIEVKNKKHD